MKNLLKSSILVLAVSVSLAACKGNGSNNGGDSSKVDSTSKTTVDTAAKVDTVKHDSTSTADTSKKPGGDTISKKTTVKTTTVKKETKKQ